MQVLAAGDLALEPLVAGHAEAMFEVLADPSLYRHLGYPPPPSALHLAEVYARLETRTSPDGAEHWLNWVVINADRAPVGYVQATVTPAGIAWIGYVFAAAHWGKGYAGRAVQAMLEHLPAAYGASSFLATVEIANAASIRLLERLGFHPASGAERQGHELSATERLFVREG